MDFLQTIKPFIAGGLAGCVATCVVQPMDMVKVRLQIAGQGQRLEKAPSAFRTAANIVRTEGAAALWTGLSAGLLRQIVYGSSRMGFFRYGTDKVRAARKAAGDDSPVPMWQKMLLGSTSGAIASFFGNPADLALVRMQADSVLPVAQQQKYTGVVDTLGRVAKAEGIFGWWRGSTPTVVRAILMNGAMLSVNEEAQERLAPYLGGQKSFATVAAASTIAGFAGAAASLPADLVRVRLQKMQKDPVTGKTPYRGFAHCAMSIARDEGITTFWRGLGTYTARIAPHVIIMLCLVPHVTEAVDMLTGKQVQKEKA